VNQLSFAIFMMLVIVITFSAIPLSLQQLHLQNAFAQDDAQTDTEQRLRQKNTGSGESANFNCGTNTLKGVPSSLSFCQTGEPPEEGTLLIEKICVPGGRECQTETFGIRVIGNNPQPLGLFSLTSGESQLVTLGPGPFSIQEGSTAADFTTTFSGDCDQTAPGSNEATGTINAGQQLTCTITNILEEK
jgi:hypothetical protein